MLSHHRDRLLGLQESDAVTKWVNSIETMKPWKVVIPIDRKVMGLKVISEGHDVSVEMG